MMLRRINCRFWLSFGPASIQVLDLLALPAHGRAFRLLECGRQGGVPRTMVDEYEASLEAEAQLAAEEAADDAEDDESDAEDE